MEIRECALIKVNDDTVGVTIVSDMFDEVESDMFKKNHPIGDQGDQFIARDPGDSLIFIKDGVYKFWDCTSNKITILGNETSDFIIGYEE